MEIMRDRPWMKSAYDRGKAVRDEHLVVEAERGLEGGVKGGTQWKEKLTKDGGIIEVEEQVLPDRASIEFVLKKRAPERWGDIIEKPNMTIHIGTINHWDGVFAKEGLNEIVHKVKALPREAFEGPETRGPDIQKAQ
jgi:hypothetical protein